VDIDMDEELAWEMVRVSFRTASELQGLLGLLKENCSAEEYQVYATPNSPRGSRPISPSSAT
jgi:hypothetical protein